MANHMYIKYLKMLTKNIPYFKLKTYIFFRPTPCPIFWIAACE